MKANELSCKDLMVGDWVNANRYECVGEMQYAEWKEIGKVVQIYEDIVVLLFFTREDDEEEIYVKDIEPIPLTPEILEKNGFICDGWSWWYLDFRIVLSTSKGVSVVCGRQKRFEFVHELQHALRLCGIEKEIEL